MSCATAKEALITGVLTALTGIPVARENANFEKPTNSKWAALYFLPNRPSVETLSDVGEDMADGIVQVDLHYPQGTGDKAADDDAETFRAAFKAGQKFTKSGQGAVIQSCGRSPGRLEDNWFVVSVTITWYALVAR